jgi:hypothetical protein
MLDPWKNLYVARTLLTAAHDEAADEQHIALLIDAIEDFVDDAMFVLRQPRRDRQRSQFTNESVKCAD